MVKTAKLHSEEGLHPLILLFFLGFAFVLGKKMSVSKKIPVVIPEVVREHPRAKTKSLALSSHRSGRRRAHRN